MRTGHRCRPTGEDGRFVGACSGCQGLATKVLPFLRQVIMMESDKASRFAGEGMFGAKFSTAAIALSRQIEGLKAISESDVVLEFLSGQGCTIEGVWDHREPTTSRAAADEAVALVRRTRLLEGCEEGLLILLFTLASHIGSLGGCQGVGGGTEVGAS